MKLVFISLTELLEMKANQDDFKLVEVLSEDSFENEHIPGAINIPADEMADRAPNELDKEDTVVVYCASYSCQASTKAARTLQEMGYEYVLDYKGGKKTWKDGGLEME